MKKERIEVDVNKLIAETYFKIAKWHNNDDELNAEDLKISLVGVSKNIIESILNSVFSDKEKGVEYKNTHVEDSGLLSGFNLDFERIKRGE